MANDGNYPLDLFRQRPDGTERFHIISQETAVDRMTAFLEGINGISPDVQQIHPDIQAALTMAKAIQADKTWRGELKQHSVVAVLDIEGNRKLTELPDCEEWIFRDNDQPVSEDVIAQNTISIIQTSNLDPTQRDIIIFTTNLITKGAPGIHESRTVEITIPTSKQREWPEQLFRIATRTTKAVTPDLVHYEYATRHSIVTMRPSDEKPRIIDIGMGVQKPNIVFTVPPPSTALQ
jgi:hypothetical protein